MARLAYYKRIVQAYLGKGNSQLSFWHGTPTLHEPAFEPDSRAYYMAFRRKAHYAGPFDDNGIPLLDYRGEIGPQYNPIAIAQYGLGCWNEYSATKRHKGHKGGDGERDWFGKALGVADWLVENLDENEHGLKVWMHHFDWEYFQLLKAPWYSGLAQGQGLSLLTRVYAETQDARYLAAAEEAFRAMVTPVDQGGTLHVDDNGHWWIEEYICRPPTHILNGFMWALWGVCDYHQLTGDGRAAELWRQSLRTLERNLGLFDCGYWSLYDLSPVRLRNLASPFYHSLHLVQLQVMHRLTGEELFGETCRRWRTYAEHVWKRRRAFAGKALFKLLYF